MRIFIQKHTFKDQQNGYIGLSVLTPGISYISFHIPQSDNLQNTQKIIHLAFISFYIFHFCRCPCLSMHSSVFYSRPLV